MKILKTAKYIKKAQFGSEEKIIKDVAKGLGGSISDRNLEWVLEQMDFEYGEGWTWRDVKSFLKNREDIIQCGFCAEFKHEEEYFNIEEDPMCKDCEAEQRELRYTEEAERGSSEFQDYPESNYNRPSSPDTMRPQY